MKVNLSFFSIIYLIYSNANAEVLPVDAGVVQRVSPSEEILKMRDPFKHPEIEVSKKVILGPLEQYGIDSFKMIGVLTGPSKMRALLRDPAGKTHIVSESVKIGTRGGSILKISEDSLLVREKIVNVLGMIENVDSVIPLVEEKK